MKRKDFYYIAGLSYPHPTLLRADKEKAIKFQIESDYLPDISSDEEARWDQLTKIQGNSLRAQEKIRFRNFFWATVFVILAALIGSFSAWLLSSLSKAII